MPVFPGDVPVQLRPTVTYKEHGVANHSLYGSLHMGTHIDAPGHFTDRDKTIQLIALPLKIDGHGARARVVALVS